MSLCAKFQLLMTQFWWNFKDRFLGTSRTDSNCHGDICPGNICPRDICPYQEYLSSNWPNFDETLKIGSWEHLEQIPTVVVTLVLAKFAQAIVVHIRNILAVADLILTKLCKWGRIMEHAFNHNLQILTSQLFYHLSSATWHWRPSVVLIYTPDSRITMVCQQTLVFELIARA